MCRTTLITLAALCFSLIVHGENLTIAAASDLKFAMDEMVTSFKNANPNADVNVIYGSSGKFYTQIQQGAPYDMFFSADIVYPKELTKAGLAVSEPKLYAIGRIVLWSNSLNATQMTLASLSSPKIEKIAIANPNHAPYGKRAEEALKAAGLWDKVQPRLVFGENISQTAQFVVTGNAQVGVIALSLAMNKTLATQGGYWLIPDTLHQPLEQGYVITKRAATNTTAQRFSSYLATKPARAILSKYGFSLPQ